MTTYYKDNYRRGWLFAGSGTLLLSVDAIIIKLANLNVAQAASWRSLLIASAIGCFLFLRRNSNSLASFHHYGLAGLTISILYGLNATLFVVSVSTTMVANTVFILCSSALFAALFSRWLLKEKLAISSWAILATSLAGVGLIFFGSIKITGWTGNVTALLLAASTGLLFTIARQHDDVPRMEAIFFGSLFAGLCLLPFAAVNPFNGNEPQQLFWLLLAGFMIKPVASVLTLTATRYVPSSEVGLLLLLEPVLAPLWAWFLLAENPDKFVLTGGFIVLFSILLQAVLRRSSFESHTFAR